MECSGISHEQICVPDRNGGLVTAPACNSRQDIHILKGVNLILHPIILYLPGAGRCLPIRWKIP